LEKKTALRVLIVLFLVLSSLSHASAAVTCKTGFDRCRIITVTNNNGTPLDNYNFRINIPYYVGMNDDLNDILITSLDKSIDLNLWKIDVSTGNDANVWFTISHIDATDSNQYLLNYDKAGQTDVSNPSALYGIFDSNTFSANSKLDGNNFYHTITINNGITVTSDAAYISAYRIILQNGATVNANGQGGSGGGGGSNGSEGGKGGNENGSAGGDGSGAGGGCGGGGGGGGGYGTGGGAGGEGGDGFLCTSPGAGGSGGASRGSNSSISILEGGAGGGGGASRDTGSFYAGGASGGDGGSYAWLQIYDIDINGTLQSQGGAGGNGANANGAGNGGGGGGGGGGSGGGFLFIGFNLDLANTAVLTVTGGSAGTGGTGSGGDPTRDGDNGSSGGGGRLKYFAENNYANNATENLGGGTTYNNTSAKFRPFWGASGSIDEQDPNINAAIGAEVGTPDVNVVRPNGGEHLFNYLQDIDFNVSDVDSGELHALIAWSTAQGAFTNVIVADLNLNNHASLSYLTCTGINWSTAQSCTYDWNLANPYVADYSAYYIDVNVWDTDTVLWGEDSSNASFDVNKYDVNVLYEDYNVYDGNYYVSDLTYDLNYRCSLPATLWVLLDGETKDTYNLTCDNTARTISDSLDLNNEGFFNARFQLNAFDASDDFNAGDQNFYADLNAPDLNEYGFIFDEGFNVTLDGLAYLLCKDTISPLLHYDLNINDANVIDDWNATDTNVQAAYPVPGVGTIQVKVRCTDLAGNTSYASYSFPIIALTFYLIDEPTGGVFDLNDANGARVYIPETSTEYDLKTNGKTNISFITTSHPRIRFEFVYNNPPGSDIIITRDFNTVVLTGSDLNELRVCADELTSFYEQLFISSAVRRVLVRNIYSDCYVLADYTDIVYEDSLSNKAFTIDMLYSITTSDGEETIILGSLDGARASVINLDVLEFKRRTYPFELETDEVSMEKVDENTILIYYYNPAQDNKSVTFKIYDGANLIFTETETSTPNEVSVYFDFSTLSIDANMLKIEVVKTFEDDTTETITRYFTLQGATGILNPVMAAIIALAITIFSLTFVSYRAALGWFGLFGILIALGVTALAISTWYLVFIQAMLVIILIFIGLVYKEEGLGVS